MSNAVIPGRPEHPLALPTADTDDGRREVWIGVAVVAAFFVLFLGWAAFARALYGDPAMLLLDEPNAHLDMEGEAQLVVTLNALKARGATVLIVAHRTGVLAAVDKLMVLREGRLDLFGPRDAVIAQLNAPRPPAAQVTAPTA